MDFECHPGDVETIMHERNDAMTKIPNIRFKRISQPCGDLVQILMIEVSKDLSGETLMKTKISLLLQAWHG